MEEKERFEIHIYDDVCVDLYNNGVLDKSINDTYKLEKLLNQQDREINRLTKMLYTTTKHADKLNEENNKLNKIIKANIISADKVVKENEKLKQQLDIIKKSLELLKYQPNYYIFVNENTETIDVDLAISKAKEMLENE